MLRDCQDLLAAGAGGIVIGALDDNGWIDTKFLRSVAAICSPAEVVFHRAFDELTDQAQGLKQLIDCGIQRVLTSGGGRTAIESVGKLKRLIELADGCIEILPGSGVSSSNAVELVAQTGCTQLHGSFTNRETHLSCPDPQEIAATLAAVHAFFNERR